MDVTDQLQAYISQIVALGQATLARHRRGEWLPDELANPAEALLALESALGAPPVVENADEVATALVEPVAAAEWSPAVDEAPAILPVQEEPWPPAEWSLPADEAPAADTPPEEAAPELPASLPVQEEAWPPAEWSLPAATAPAADTPPKEAAPELPASLPVQEEAWPPAEWSLPAAATPPEEAATGEPPLLFAQDETPRVETIAAMSPVEADDWLSSLANDSSGLLILPTSEVGDAVKDDYLVIDVEEEAGGGPATIHSPADALPPLVVNATDMLGPTNVFSESDAGVSEVAAESDAWLPLFGNAPDAFAPTNVFGEADGAVDEAPAVAAESDALPLFISSLDVFAPTNVFGEADAGISEAAPVAAESDAAAEAGAPEVAAPAMDEAAPGPALELRFCTNCGVELRPGRRFCHRCGESVARMLAEALADAAPPAAAPPPARDEWPTFISDAPRYETSAPPAPVPAMARFCNNCGLGLEADAKVCPDCGSRDIS